jgi:hypothetical protein
MQNVTGIKIGEWVFNCWESSGLIYARMPLTYSSGELLAAGIYLLRVYHPDEDITLPFIIKGDK